MLSKNNIFLLLAGIMAFVSVSAFLVYRQNTFSAKRDDCLIDLPDKRLPKAILIDDRQNIDVYESLQEGRVLLVFMLADCTACQKEAGIISESLPLLLESDVRIYGIARENNRRVQEFIDKFDVKFPILYDPDGKLFDQLPVKCTPTNFVLENGRIKKILIGGPKDRKMLLEDLGLSDRAAKTAL